jgi:hypothetical protein
MNRTAVRLVKILCILSLGLSCILRSVSSAAQCDYYASPKGAADGKSISTPFQVSKFWAAAVPGKTLCLLDGEYQYIQPPVNLKGEAGKPITIKALNEGNVMVNGQFKAMPVKLEYNDYFIIEGINACNGTNAVVQILNGKHNQIKKVCAWDATNTNDGNTEIFGVHTNSSHNLFEDCAGWGRCRKVFQNSYGGNNTTYRRCFAKWTNNYGDNSGGEMCYSLAYHSQGTIIENCIGTWDGVNKSKPPRCIFSNDDPCDTPHLEHHGYKLLGCLAYLNANDTYQPDTLFHSIYLDDVVFKDLVAVTAGWRINLQNYFRCGGMGGDHHYPATNAVATGITAIGLSGVGGMYLGKIWFGSDWKVSDTVAVDTIDAESNPFTGTKGAKLCYKYVDGMLTKEKLWPWPMNERIKNAMMQAGRTVVDVTQTMEVFFGPIPDSCGGSQTPQLIPLGAQQSLKIK